MTRNQTFPQATSGSTTNPGPSDAVKAKEPAPPYLGLYESISPRDPQSLNRLQEMSQAGFNTVLNYAILDGTPADINRYLDKAQSLGIKVIFSIKDFYDLEKNPDINLADFSTYGATNDQITLSIVKTFKNHPALYGWYISDERPEKPEDAGRWIPALLNRYKAVKSEDPKHPAIITLACYQDENAAHWSEILPQIIPATDEFAFDSYPVPYGPLDAVGQCANVLAKAVSSDRRWFVVQAFSWASYPDTVRADQQDPARARYPTVDEMTAMIRSAKQAGIDNLMFYSYFDLKNDGTNFPVAWSNLQQAIRKTNN